MTHAPASSSAAAAVLDLDWRCAQVTVFEDRADVLRVAEVDLPAGPCAVRFAGLSPLVDEARLVARLEVPGGGAAPGHARVDDTIVQRRLVDDGADAAVERRQRRERERERLDDERRGADDDLAACEAARAQAEAALSTFMTATGRRLGRTGAWAGIEDDVGRLAERIRAAHDAVAAARAAVERAAAARAGLDAPATMTTTTKRLADVVVRVSATTAGPARVVLSTVVPCGAWRPSHEARLVRGDGVDAADVTVTTHASVWNRTGEPWRGARLVLSTARPSLGAEVPSLHEDRLQVRTKTAAERRTVVVEHRTEAVPPSATRGGAPGVDDGGEVRVYAVDDASVPDDGRPHLLQLAAFTAPAALSRVCLPEAQTLVFLRASLRNAGRGPLLAGPIALFDEGAWVGTGDVLYTGQGDELELSFGSDDRFTVRFDKRTKVDRRLVGRDVVHYVQETTLSSTAKDAEDIVVVVRLPVSELAAVVVQPSPQHGTVVEVRPDEHGLVRAPVRVEPGRDRVVAVAFTFDVTGDVALPPPW
jgi:uncharacterized protein (TIGR02231 family)